MKFNQNLVWLGLASFVVYAIAVWSLGQHLVSQYSGEQLIIASAASHALLGTDIGSAHWGVIKDFLSPSDTTQNTLASLRGGGIEKLELGGLWSTQPDGLGIVMVSVVSILFRLFGVTLAVFPALALGVLAVASAAFMVRFKDERLFVIPVHFFVLTALLLTPLSTNPDILNQFPIGGLRYFGLLAILPAMHIMFEVFDRTPLTKAALATLAIQAFVFLLALNIRGASIYLLLAISTLVFFSLRTKSARIDRRNLIIKSCTAFSLLTLSAILVYATAPPDYRNEGRVTGVVWHRVLISLGAHPAWPFGDLKARLHLCAPPYTQPLGPGITDATGGCFWIQHARETGMNDGAIIRGYAGSTDERVARNAFFRIAAEFPKEVFETFAYYKPVSAVAHFRLLMDFRTGLADGKYRIALFCFLAQIVLLCLTALVRRAAPSIQMPAVCGLFFAWSIFPIIVAWANLNTIADVGYWFLVTTVCATLAIIDLAKSVLLAKRTAVAESDQPGAI